MTGREALAGCTLIVVHTALMLAAMEWAPDDSAGRVALGQVAATVVTIAGMWYAMVARPARRRRL